MKERRGESLSEMNGQGYSKRGLDIKLESMQTGAGLAACTLDSSQISGGVHQKSVGSDVQSQLGKNQTSSPPSASPLPTLPSDAVPAHTISARAPGSSSSSQIGCESELKLDAETFTARAGTTEISKEELDQGWAEHSQAESQDAHLECEPTQFRLGLASYMELNKARYWLKRLCVSAKPGNNHCLTLHAGRELFPGSDCLKWTDRKPMLQAEFEHHASADIICLQVRCLAIR